MTMEYSYSWRQSAEMLKKTNGLYWFQPYLSSEDTVDHDYDKALQGVKDREEDLE